LKTQSSNRMVEVLNLGDLFDPHKGDVSGRYHAGEEMQDPENFSKSNLVFPSGEKLPRCWVDASYRDS
jgi:hypothetical protein